MSPLFQRSTTEKEQSSKRGSSSSTRTPRHSSGWKKLLEKLKVAPGLRVLDIGPTSPTNINFLTSLGHSVYMADLVEEAVKPEWAIPVEAGEAPRYHTESFLARHMDFGDRKFDVILLWDTLDYLPMPMTKAILGKLTQVITEQGTALAFFHSRMAGPETVFCRYHVQDGDTIQAEAGTPHPVLCNYQNRQIETLLQPLGSYRFLLAKDNTREVIVSRS
ncbi:MAG: methyltransferase domain-containing protein [Acidobacteriaceae bacterium]